MNKKIKYLKLDWVYSQWSSGFPGRWIVFFHSFRFFKNSSKLTFDLWLWAISKSALSLGENTSHHSDLQNPVCHPPSASSLLCLRASPSLWRASSVGLCTVSSPPPGYPQGMLPRVSAVSWFNRNSPGHHLNTLIHLILLYPTLFSSIAFNLFWHDSLKHFVFVFPGYGNDTNESSPRAGISVPCSLIDLVV